MKPLCSIWFLPLVFILAGCPGKNNPAAPGPPGPTVVRVAAGSSSPVTDIQGNVWSADMGYSGATAANSFSASIGNTPDPALYLHERIGSTGTPVTYTFPAQSGAYQVTLKFAETYATGAGQRVFNASINGVTVLTNFDIYAAAGPNTADDRVFDGVTPSGGNIQIVIGPASANNAKVDALQIIPQSQASHPFLMQFGGAGTGNGQFTLPVALTVDDGGNVYVVDAGTQKRVEKFSSSGAYLTQWGSTGSSNGQFQSPLGVAWDSYDGYVDVVDYLRGDIQDFNASGAYQGKFASTANGRAIANDRAGDTFVGDHADQVEVFSSGGGFIQWGGTGSGNGQFNLITGVAADQNGNVYVSDGTNRVQKLNSSGTYSLQWGATGSGNGQSSAIFGLAVDDRNGHVYALDASNDRVQEFDASGNYLAQWGSQGSGNGQFNITTNAGVAVDGSGNVYVIDSGNNRVEKFGP